MLSLLVMTALAEPLSVDLDGDGKAESLTVRDATWKVNGVVLPCRAEEGECEVSVLDISAADLRKELAVCAVEIRDWRACEVWTWARGALSKLPFADGQTHERLETSGNGVVLARDWRGFYTRTLKFTEASGKLVEARQPFWYVGVDVHVEATGPIYLAAGGGDVVANIRPDSDVTVLVESASVPGWFLVKLGSGITGWIELSKLAEVSAQVSGTLSAG